MWTIHIIFQPYHQATPCKHIKVRRLPPSVGRLTHDVMTHHGSTTAVQVWDLRRTNLVLLGRGMVNIRNRQETDLRGGQLLLYNKKVVANQVGVYKSRGEREGTDGCRDDSRSMLVYQSWYIVVRLCR